MFYVPHFSDFVVEKNLWNICWFLKPAGVGEVKYDFKSGKKSVWNQVVPSRTKNFPSFDREK